nr:MAG TPA: hypothetical protein [Caudoviricetes sp.]
MGRITTNFLRTFGRLRTIYETLSNSIQQYLALSDK